MENTEDLATICPLCGGANHCAIAAGQPAESCWCQTAVFSPAALAAIPEAARGKYCICAACGAIEEKTSCDR